MSERVITVAHQRLGVKRISSSAKVWKDLVPQIRDAGFPIDDTKAVLAGVEMTIESPEAILPETNCRIYLVPIGIKGGAGKKSSEFDGKTSAELKNYLKEQKDIATTEKDKKILEVIGAYSKDKVEDLKAKAEKVSSLLSRRKPKTTTTAAKKETPVKKTTAKTPAKKASAKPVAKKETATKAKAVTSKKSIADKKVLSDETIMKDYGIVVAHLKLVINNHTIGHHITI